MTANSEDDIFTSSDPNEAETERLKNDYAVQLEVLRKHKKLSYRQVAELYGRSAGYISRVFRGDENVTIGTMVRLARVLDGCVSITVMPQAAKGKVWPYHERRKREINVAAPTITTPVAVVLTNIQTEVNPSPVLARIQSSYGFNVLDTKGSEAVTGNTFATMKMIGPKTDMRVGKRKGTRRQHG